jgi:PD-(D/E)XK endonuclease
MEYAGKTRRTWTDEQLVAAVRDGRSWRDAARRLGLSGHGPSPTVKREVVRLGLDTSHFGASLLCSDDDLKAALATATSWGKLLAVLGLRTASRRARQVVATRAEHLGLRTDHLDAALRKRRVRTAECSLVPDLVHLREAAESLTVAWFLLRGFWPAVPVEPRHYDFLLETPAGVKRIQVKTTTFRASSGSWHVTISRHAGGGSKHDQRLAYRSDEVDLFAVVDGDLTLSLIPRAAVADRKAICLRRYGEFGIGTAASIGLPRPVAPETGTEPLFRLPAETDEVATALKPTLPFMSDGASEPSAEHPRRDTEVGTCADDAATSVHNLTARDGAQGYVVSRWPEGELRAAAEKSTSWADMLRSFGFKPSSTKPRRQLQREVQRLGIDTSHFAGKRTWSDSQLIETARTARSWTELCDALGLSVRSGHYDSIRAAAKRLGVSLERLQVGPKASRDAVGIDLPSQGALDRVSVAAPSIAAAWFLLCGLAVSIPSEPEPYDLVVDMSHELKRVQVKTASFRDRGGSWVGHIGHRPDGSPDGSDLVAYQAEDVDLFFIIDGDMLLYLIPLSAIGERATLSLRNYREFTVGDASSLLDSRNPTSAPCTPTEGESQPGLVHPGGASPITVRSPRRRSSRAAEP